MSLCLDPRLVSAPLGLRNMQNRYQVRHFPKPIRDIDGHRRRHAKRLMSPEEIVICKVKPHDVRVVLDLQCLLPSLRSASRHGSGRTGVLAISFRPDDHNRTLAEPHKLDDVRCDRKDTDGIVERYSGTSERRLRVKSSRCGYNIEARHFRPAKQRPSLDAKDEALHLTTMPHARGKGSRRVNFKLTHGRARQSCNATTTQPSSVT